MTIDVVVNLLERYWKIAVITEKEDKRLERSKMPAGWNKTDIHLQYANAGIILEAASDVAGSSGSGKCQRIAAVPASPPGVKK